MNINKKKQKYMNHTKKLSITFLKHEEWNIVYLLSIWQGNLTLMLQCGMGFDRILYYDTGYNDVVRALKCIDSDG